MKESVVWGIIGRKAKVIPGGVNPMKLKVLVHPAEGWLEVAAQRSPTDTQAQVLEIEL